MTRVIMEDSSNNNVEMHTRDSMSQINDTQKSIYDHILKHTIASGSS